MLLNVGRNRGSYKIDKSNIIDHTKDDSMIIPLQYQQDKYEVENNCVWLSTCLVMQTVDESMARKLLKYYENNVHRFE